MTFVKWEHCLKMVTMKYLLSTIMSLSYRVKHFSQCRNGVSLAYQAPNPTDEKPEDECRASPSAVIPHP